MSEKNIKTLKVGKLKGKRFCIPDYQRGYRWTKYEVNDSLNYPSDTANYPISITALCLAALFKTSFNFVNLEGEEKY